MCRGTSSPDSREVLLAHWSPWSDCGAGRQVGRQVGHLSAGSNNQSGSGSVSPLFSSSQMSYFSLLSSPTPQSRYQDIIPLKTRYYVITDRCHFQLYKIQRNVLHNNQWNEDFLCSSKSLFLMIIFFLVSSKQISQPELTLRFFCIEEIIQKFRRHWYWRCLSI